MQVHQVLSLPPRFMVLRRMNPATAEHYKTEFESIDRDDPQTKAEDLTGVRVLSDLAQLDD